MAHDPIGETSERFLSDTQKQIVEQREKLTVAVSNMIAPLRTLGEYVEAIGGHAMMLKDTQIATQYRIRLLHDGEKLPYGARGYSDSPVDALNTYTLMTIERFADNDLIEISSLYFPDKMTAQFFTGKGKMLMHQYIDIEDDFALARTQGSQLDPENNLRALKATVGMFERCWELLPV